MSSKIQDFMTKMRRIMSSSYRRSQARRRVQSATTMHTASLQAQTLSEMPEHLELLRSHHQHVANAIYKLWGTPDCLNYIQQLTLVSRTDPRSGFAPEVIKTLECIRDSHTKIFPATECIWSAAHGR